MWLHGAALLSRFLSYVEVLSPVHSGCWVAAGTTGSGSFSTTRSSCLHAGHREYRNQDLTSCKRMPARGGVSSCWQCLHRKTRCLLMPVPPLPRWLVGRGPDAPTRPVQGGSPGFPPGREEESSTPWDAAPPGVRASHLASGQPEYPTHPCPSPPRKPSPHVPEPLL